MFLVESNCLLMVGGFVFVFGQCVVVDEEFVLFEIVMCWILDNYVFYLVMVLDWYWRLVVLNGFVEMFLGFMGLVEGDSLIEVMLDCVDLWVVIENIEEVEYQIFLCLWVELVYLGWDVVLSGLIEWLSVWVEGYVLLV